MSTPETVDVATQTPPKPGPPPSRPEPDTGSVEPTDWQAEAAKWRDLAKEHEKKWRAATRNDSGASEAIDELKETKRKASEYDSLKRKASEYDSLAERIAAIEAERDAARVDAMRANIAAEKGVPAALLTGTTAEELATSADALLEFRGAAPKPPAAPPATGQGNVGQPIGDGLPDQLTRADLNGMSPDQIEAARAQGRLNALLGIK